MRSTARHARASARDSSVHLAAGRRARPVETGGPGVESADNCATEGDARSDHDRDRDNGHDQAVLGQCLTVLILDPVVQTLHGQERAQRQILEHRLPLNSAACCPGRVPRYVLLDGERGPGAERFTGRTSSRMRYAQPISALDQRTDIPHLSREVPPMASTKVKVISLCFDELSMLGSF